MHTRCVMDHDHLSSAVCNSHGTPKHSSFSKIEDVECACEDGYGGKYCDFCQDPTLAYPDCKEYSAQMYHAEATHAYLGRRKYNENGYSTHAA